MRHRQTSIGLMILMALSPVLVLASPAGAQTFTLIPNPTPQLGDFFGVHVAAVGTDKILVGAPGDNTMAPSSGAAYLFDLQGNLLKTFHSPKPVENEHFGRWCIGVGDDRVLISAVQDEDLLPGKPTLPGMSYLFELNGELVQTFANPNPSINDVFGRLPSALGSASIRAASRILSAGTLVIVSAFSGRYTSSAIMKSHPSALHPLRVGGTSAGL